MKRVMIVGDVHGEFVPLQFLINEKHTEQTLDAVIVCGDYGIWNDFKKDSVPARYNIKTDIPIYFIDGNHDNHTELDKYERGKVHHVIGNLFYCAFGSTLNFDGYTFLFCGGALSIDKHHRKEGISWWPTECISEDDMKYLPDCNVNAIVSHTAPLEICKKICMDDFWNYRSGKIYNDPSPKFLDTIANRYKPASWYFGHWHKYFVYTNKRTKFFGLNMLPTINTYSPYMRVGKFSSNDMRAELYDALLLNHSQDDLIKTKAAYYLIDEFGKGNE